MSFGLLFYSLCPEVGETSTQHSLQSILKTLGYTPLVQRRIWQEYTDYLIPSLHGSLPIIYDYRYLKNIQNR